MTDIHESILKRHERHLRAKAYRENRFKKGKNFFS